VIEATVEAAAAVLAPADPDRAIEAAATRRTGRNTIIAPKIERREATNGTRTAKSTRRNLIVVMTMMMHPIRPRLYQTTSVPFLKKIPNKASSTHPSGDPAAAAEPPTLVNTA